MKNRERIKNIAVTALGVVLLTVCSWISVSGVTLQTFAVFFLIDFLGAKRGALTVFAYVLTGAIGIPVFSGFGGGIGWLFGPTGGFLFGFLAVSLLYMLAEALFKRHISRLVLKVPLLVISLLLCYLCGAFNMYSYYLESGSSISFIGVFLGFIPLYGAFDALKIFLACYLAKYMKRIKPI